MSTANTFLSLKPLLKESYSDNYKERGMKEIKELSLRKVKANANKEYLEKLRKKKDNY